MQVHIHSSFFPINTIEHHDMWGWLNPQMRNHAYGGTTYIWMPAISYTCCACMCAKLLQLCSTFCNPMDLSPPGSSVHEILMQEYWSGLQSPPSEGLSHPEIQSMSLLSSALASSFFCLFVCLFVCLFLPWKPPREPISYTKIFKCTGLDTSLKV